MPVSFFLVLSALLFSIGVYGVLAREHAVLVLLSIELMLNAVNVNLVAFDVWLRDTLHTGQTFALVVLALAAAEVGVGLAIVLLIFRNRETVDLDNLRELADPGMGADTSPNGATSRPPTGQETTGKSATGQDATGQPPISPGQPVTGEEATSRPGAASRADSAGRASGEAPP